MANLSGNSVDRIATDSVIEALRQKGIHFWVENGTLRYRAPKGVVTADDISRLRQLGPLYSLEGSETKVHGLEPHAVPRLQRTLFPLAYTQLGHWNLRASSGYRPVRQVASVTRIRGPLDAGALKEGFSMILARHESLRTRIVVVGGEPRQEVSNDSGNGLQAIDLTSLGEQEQRLEIQRQIARAIMDVSDYAHDPLFQVALMKVGKQDHVLLLAFDHMVSDGASLSILLHELLQTHAQALSGRMALPPMQLQFPDYALWQREALSGLLRARASTWSGWQRTRFPEDLDATGQAGCGTVRFVIKARMRGALQDWARSHGTSLVLTVLTGYVALIARWCTTCLPSIQVMSDGRTSVLVENTVGYLAFPLYLRIPVSFQESFVDLLETVTKEFCKASERLDFGYSYAQRPEPEFVHNTCFNWLPIREENGGSLSRARISPLTLSRVAFENPCLETFEWDVDPWVLFQDSGQDVLVEIGFPRKRFSHRAMERFSANLNKVLGALLSKPTMELRCIEIG